MCCIIFVLNEFRAAKVLLFFELTKYFDLKMLFSAFLLCVVFAKGDVSLADFVEREPLLFGHLFHFFYHIKV